MRGYVFRSVLTGLIVFAMLALPAAAQEWTKSVELKKSYKKYQALDKAGRYGEAIPHARRVLELGEKEFGPNSNYVGAFANNLAWLYKAQGLYKEAELLFKRDIEIQKKAKGSDHPYVGNGLSHLAGLYHKQGRYGEAELLFKRDIEIQRKAKGPDHSNVGHSINNLAELYRVQGRYGEAEPLFKLSLSIREKAKGKDHPILIKNLKSLAKMYYAQERYKEADLLYRRVFFIDEKKRTGNAPPEGTILRNLAQLYESQGRYDEAETLYKQSLVISEKKLGPNTIYVSDVLDDLAEIYQVHGRFSEAELLYKRSLAIRKKHVDPGHVYILYSLANMASLYHKQKRYREAEALYKRALKMNAFAMSVEHIDSPVVLNNLALLYSNQGRYKESEALYKRALAIEKKVYGKPDESTLNNLAALYYDQGNYSKAESLYKRSLAIFEKANEPNSKGSETILNNLAALKMAQRKWALAVKFSLRATGILERHSEREHGGRGIFGHVLTGKKKTGMTNHASYAKTLIKSFFRNNASPEAGREMFETAQWAIGSQAASALARMSARLAAGSDELANIVRERQDIVRIWQKNDVRMNALRASDQSDKTLKELMVRLDKRIVEIDKRLGKEFPDYWALISPKPLTIKQVQKLLKPDEALILLLDTPKLKPTPAETFIWAVTHDKAVWKRAEFGGDQLANEVAALRCGLDASNWASPAGWPTTSKWDKQAKATQQARRDKCIKLIGKAYSDRQWPPFDLGRAHKLYQKLLGPIEDIIKGKQLLVVASGPLTGLPFQVLVTKKPTQAFSDDGSAYKNAGWLAAKHAITTLPSVASLKALRGIAKKAGRAASNSEAVGKTKKQKPLMGFADPEFSSAKPGEKRMASRGSFVGNYASFFRGRNVDLATLSGLSQLPGTRTELQRVGKTLRVDEKHLKYGRDASERAVKAAKLDQYRIVYFATHGLIAGDVKGLGEPALAFSLPAKISPEDDGLLTASEVTQLKLNADWVVMSACNTAAAEKPGAEALSGLARAFFYAGAKTLLVSHWPVGDEAAVALTTHAFKEMQANPKLGRSQALRRSMLALLGKGGMNAHPTVWAPFVVVGEGSADVSKVQTLAKTQKKTIPRARKHVMAQRSKAAKRKAAAKEKKKASPEKDWRREVFGFGE